MSSSSSSSSAAAAEEEESSNESIEESQKRPKRKRASTRKPNPQDIQKEKQYQLEGSQYVGDCLCLEYLYWSLTGLLLAVINKQKDASYEDFYLKARAIKTAIIGFEARVAADDLPWIQENFEDLDPLNSKRKEFTSLVEKHAPYLPVWKLISEFLLELVYGMRDLPGIGERAHRKRWSNYKTAMAYYKTKAPKMNNDRLPKWSWATGQSTDGDNCNFNTKDELELLKALEKGGPFSPEEVEEIKQRLPLSYILNPNHKEWKEKTLQEGGYEGSVLEDIDRFRYFRSHLGPKDMHGLQISLLSDLTSHFMKLIGVAYNLDWKKSQSFKNFREKLERRAKSAGQDYPFGEGATTGKEREDDDNNDDEENKESANASLQEWLLWRASRFVLLSAVQKFALFGDSANFETYIFCFYSWGPRPWLVPDINPDVQSRDKLDEFWKDFWSQTRVKKHHQMYMRRMMRTFWGDGLCHRVQVASQNQKDEPNPLPPSEVELNRQLFKNNLEELSRQMFPENGGYEHLPMSQMTDLGDTLRTEGQENPPPPPPPPPPPKWNLIPPKGYTDFYAEIISFVGELASQLPEPVLRYYAKQHLSQPQDYRRSDLPSLPKESLTTLDQFLSGLFNQL